MSDKFFLDTNVIVYAFDQKETKKSRIAQSLIAQGAADNRAIISYQVIQEFVNVVLRGFRVSITSSDLESFLFSALFPMAAISWSPALTMEALRIQAAHRIGWYDSLILAAAQQGDCEVLYSEDLRHEQRFGNVTVRNPFVA
jgi:predicted nucleic acid-binding protein